MNCGIVNYRQIAVVVRTVGFSNSSVNSQTHNSQFFRHGARNGERRGAREHARQGGGENAVTAAVRRQVDQAEDRNAREDRGQSVAMAGATAYATLRLYVRR